MVRIKLFDVESHSITAKPFKKPDDVFIGGQLLNKV
jgi:hypothetical protein